MKSLLQHFLRLWKIHRNPVGYARSIGVTVGQDCRILGMTPTTFGSEPYLVRLGRHVTITAGTRFVTHDGGVWIFRDEHPNIDVFGPITVGDNVFIGMNSIIMPGVSVGNNCVIGAGSVVTRDIPPDCVAVGAPAKPIRTLAEYWEKIQPDVFHIRNLPYQEKRKVLQERFFSQ